MKEYFIYLPFILTFISCNSNGQKTVSPYDVVANNDTCNTIDNYLIKLAAEKNFSGALLIIKDGRKIFSKGYGWANKEQKIPFTSSTLASIGSITKAFTATAIMRLAEEGKLSLSDPLQKFFSNAPADKAAITIHQLLTHSSGFHEFLQNDGGDFRKIDKEEFLKKAFSEPLAFKPGERAVYSNIGMSILAIIIEKISGTDYETYLKKHLFEPIGINRISYCYPALKTDTIAVGYQNGNKWGTNQQHYDAAGGGPYWNLKGNGGLEASLNDIYLWANAFTNHTILHDTTIQKMFTAQIPEDGYNGKMFFGYGCNVSPTRRNTKLIDNGGSDDVYFARLVRLPQEGVVLYMVTNESSINTDMVLPNVSHLYFTGNIAQDALTMKPKFETPMAAKIYDILKTTKTTDLGVELEKENIKVVDDQILLEVGQKFMDERKADEALSLYRFYTKEFPNIVVAWNDMGDVYLMKDNKEEAKKCYEQALKLRPGNPRAIENLNKLNK